MRIALILLCPAFALLPANARSLPDTVRAEQATIDPGQRYQSIEGWGSSLCWWAGQVGQWDKAKIDTLIELFTAPDKLNMNLFRYNIGGGDDPSHRGGHMLKGKGERAEMEGFKDSPTAPYRWEADAGQRNILLAIREKRPDAVFEAFSNSAPYWMTHSGCAAGHADGKRDNLKPEYYEAFCDYLIDVCSHYKQAYGIEFRTLEPFNEPLSDYWYAYGSQEGCHFDAESQMKLIRMLYPKLEASGLNTVLAASDETCLAHFLATLKSYMAAGDILDKLGQLNTHTYSGTNPEREEVRRLVQPTGKRFWQSETGPSGGSGLESNLLLTQKMFDDMRILRPDAWLDWQLIEEHNNEWCVVRADFRRQTFRVLKNFYVRMQVTRFFRQGYTLIESGHSQVLAALSPDGRKLAIAVLNPANEPCRFRLDLSRFSLRRAAVKGWRTSATEDCRPLPAPELPAGEQWEYLAPAQSLTTFVVSAKRRGLVR